MFTVPESAPEGALVAGAEKTIQALRDQHAIQEWHELDIEIVLATARGVMTSRGIAKSQMIAQLIAARAKLPEPVIQENDEVIRYEADRELEWFDRHQAADSSDVPDSEKPAPVL